MSAEQVNYDHIARDYHGRYDVRALSGVAAALHSLAREIGAASILDVGCGTGRWLSEFHQKAGRACGLDLSLGMLQQARHKEPSFRLVVGRADQLPFAGAAFDLIVCVNALHHFAQPRTFIAEAHRLLRRGGALAVVGMDPHSGRDNWCVYEYFEGTHETDIARFPSLYTLLDWVAGAGFAEVTWRPVERILDRQVGKDVFESHFLQKHGTSQLTLLTDEAYAAGLERMRAALSEAEAAGETITFVADIILNMVTGIVR